MITSDGLLPSEHDPLAAQRTVRHHRLSRRTPNTVSPFEENEVCLDLTDPELIRSRGCVSGSLGHAIAALQSLTLAPLTSRARDDRAQCHHQSSHRNGSRSPPNENRTELYKSYSAASFASNLIIPVPNAL